MKAEIKFEDGVIFIKQCGTIDEVEAKEIVDEELRLIKEKNSGRRTPVMVSLDEAESVDSGARKVFAEANKLDVFERVAMVGGTIFIRTVANFIFRMSGKQDKTKFFVNKEEALIWLKKKN